MPQATEYREAGLFDVNAIAQVESDTKRQCGLTTPDIYDIQRLRNRWDGYLRRARHPQHAEEPRIVYAAIAADRMVGFIAGHFSHRYGTEGELESIHVLKEFQCRGAGTKLLDLLAEWFVSHKRKVICVGIDPFNPYKRFYEKHGTRPINKHWQMWDDISRLLGR